jgi:hypothetical protein
MQDENSINAPDAPDVADETTDEENKSEFQAPPPPAPVVEREPPQMSEVGTLVGIFFEPGKTFEDLRRKPRFLLALVIVTLLATAYGFGLYYKVGPDNMKKFVAQQIDKSPQTQGMSAEQKSSAVEMNMTIGKVARFAFPVILALIIALVSLFYWLGAKAFGGTGNYLHALAVFVYSALPPALVGTIANFIVLALKSVDDIDIAASQRGVIHANPGFLLDGKAMPVLATLVGTLDVFMIWGWILAAIGLRITNRISSGSAWAITIIVALIGVALRVLGAVFSGNPT